VVELVDTQDLKSCDHCGRAGSSPAPGTESEFDNITNVSGSDFFFFELFRAPVCSKDLKFHMPSLGLLSFAFIIFAVFLRS
jgi:hypothetical protein